MAIKTVIVKQVFGFDLDQKERYFLRSVTMGKLTSEKLYTQASQICGAHRGVIQQVMAGVIDVLINNLDEGLSVQLGDFGTFRSAIRSKAVNSEEDATTHTIRQRKIIFTPGKALKAMLEKAPVTRYAIPDTDYTKVNTDGGGGNEENPGDGGDSDSGSGGFVDPTA